MNIEGTEAFAKEFVGQILEKESAAHKAGRATVVGLYGDLGSGKTTFMQFFGQALGIKEKILSPTFVIEKIYKIGGVNVDGSESQKKFEHLIHIDAYRLESENELVTLGWQEIISNPKNLICVEWADKIPGIIPKDHVRLKFAHREEGSRMIEVELAK